MHTNSLNRREAIQHSLVATAAIVAAWRSPSLMGATAAGGPFQLDRLPYAYDALEPHVDARTMEIHHGKHHAAYVANLNKAVAGKPNLESRSLEDLLRNLGSLPEGVRTAVRNNGGGHFNHGLFWRCMRAGGGGEPAGELGAEITKSFGSFARFQEDFTKAAMSQFGSGWAWLLWNGTRLEVQGLPNQDAPLAGRSTAVLGVDVWEHAYYLKYQNRRADYLAAFFKVVNWDFATERFQQAKRG